MSTVNYLIISQVKGSFIFFREKKNVILYSLDLFPLKRLLVHLVESMIYFPQLKTKKNEKKKWLSYFFSEEGMKDFIYLLLKCAYFNVKMWYFTDLNIINNYVFLNLCGLLLGYEIDQGFFPV